MLKHVIFTVIGLCLLSNVTFAANLTKVSYVSCYDGDTCVVNVNNVPKIFGYHLRIRLWGIDAPEIQGKCEYEKQLAKEARDFLREQLKGKALILQHVLRDKYFRVLATVMADSVNVNQLMIDRKYAVLYLGSGPKNDWCAK